MIRNADRIIVREHSRILEEGTHDSLLANSGHYADLYHTSFRQQSLEAIEAPRWLEDAIGSSATAD
jgi:ATP-binding cassette subfamily B protein